MWLPDIQIIKHGRFFVVRDDLIPGGTKRRVLDRILPKVEQELLVYAAHAYWYAWLALALSARDHNKRVKLFFPDEDHNTKIFQDTINCENVEYEIVKNISTQWELSKIAIEYSQENNWYCFPIWFKNDIFRDACTQMISEMSVTPKEVRCLWWSWTLSKCIKRAWSDTKLIIVDLWMWNWVLEWYEVYKAPELPSEKAEILPPFPSSVYYDAKVRRFVEKLWSDWALIRNVA